MALKAFLVTVATLSVLVAGATVAWPSSPSDSSNSTNSSSGLRLLVSASADRSNARKLQEAYLSGKVAIFTNRPGRVRSVAFYLDDPKMVASPRHVDYYWPFDFAGTASGGGAQLFDTSQLTAGRHVVTAKAALSGGAKVAASAVFYKSSSPSEPTTTPPLPTVQPTASISPSTTTTTRPVTTVAPTPTVAPSTSTTTSKPTDSTATTQPRTTPTPTITTTTQPPQDGLPGVPAGTSLTTQNGNMTINSAGTIVENKLINGCITVNAANVIIRKSKVFCSGTAIENNSTGLLVEDTEISCKNTRGTALTWQNFTARRINAYACENIIWAENNVLVEDSYIHDPIDYDPVTDPHTDSIQIPRGGANITIRRNTIYGNYVNQNSFGNAAVAVGSGTANILITENVLAGGGYTVYCNQAGPGDNFRITNNHFSRIFVSTVGGFGPWTECKDETQVTGNVYHETGQAL